MVDQRTATSRTYETSVPGVLVTQQHTAPINAETDDGWEPIDPTFEPDDDGYTNAVDRIDVAVAMEADADELGALSLPSGASVAFGLAGADAVEAEREAVESATPPFEDWAEIEGTGLRAALRWAHANGVACAASFQPGQPLRRSTAANWIRRAKTGIGCTGTEAQ